MQPTHSKYRTFNNYLHPNFLLPNTKKPHWNTNRELRLLRPFRKMVDLGFEFLSVTFWQSKPNSFWDLFSYSTHNEYHKEKKAFVDAVTGNSHHIEKYRAVNMWAFLGVMSWSRIWPWCVTMHWTFTYFFSIFMMGIGLNPGQDHVMPRYTMWALDVHNHLQFLPSWFIFFVFLTSRKQKKL